MTVSYFAMKVYELTCCYINILIISNKIILSLIYTKRYDYIFNSNDDVKIKYLINRTILINHKSP